MEIAAPRAESSRAYCSCWMLVMDAGPWPSRTRGKVLTDHPKFLLRRFQAPVFSWWHVGLEINNCRRIKSPSPTAGWSPEPGAIAAIAQAPLKSHGKSGSLPPGPAAPANTLCILAFQTVVASLCPWVPELSLATADQWSTAGMLWGSWHCLGLLGLLAPGTAMGWDREKPWVLLHGGGWRPGSTHCSVSRQLPWITHSCAQRHEISAPVLQDIHSASHVLSTREASIAFSLQQGYEHFSELCSEQSTWLFDKTSFS